MNGLLGKKVGMTQVLDASGALIPVTVLSLGPCVVLQRKTDEHEGYRAYQIGYGDRKPQRASRAEQGHARKAHTPPKYLVREFSSDREHQVGDTVTVAELAGVGHVDVLAISKGKGFQGVVARYGFSGFPASHGAEGHRLGGAIGTRTWPGRVFKNLRMPGHQGAEKVTVQNLKVIETIEADHLLLVQGAVPGPRGGWVVVRKAIKKPSQPDEAAS